MQKKNWCTGKEDRTGGGAQGFHSLAHPDCRSDAVKRPPLGIVHRDDIFLPELERQRVAVLDREEHDIRWLAGQVEREAAVVEVRTTTNVELPGLVRKPVPDVGATPLRRLILDQGAPAPRPARLPDPVSEAACVREEVEELGDQADHEEQDAGQVGRLELHAGISREADELSPNFLPLTVHEPCVPARESCDEPEWKERECAHEPRRKRCGLRHGMLRVATY